jgi:hypothetical protein
MATDSDIDNVLRCPFCSGPIAEPRELTSRFGSVFMGWKCSCGAVYVYDQSGHNLGDAYVDALIFACEGDADKAWSLTPDEDYEVMELGYDSRRGKFSQARKMKTPTYLFIRLKTSPEKK